MVSYLAKLTVVVLAVLLVAIAISLGTVFLQTHREYRAFVERERVISTRLEETRTGLVAREEYLRLILTDADFLERIIREKLGYAHPGEAIYRFDPARPAAPSSAGTAARP